MINFTLRRLARLWHKRAGIFSALVVVFLSLTGILLNHSSELGLGSVPVRSPMLQALYGIEGPEVRSVSLSLNKTPYWLNELDSDVFLNEQHLHRCDKELISGVELDKQWALVCDKSIALFDSQTMTLIESIDRNYGLPVPISAASRCDAHLCILVNDVAYKVDLEALRFTPAEHTFNIQSSQTPPKALQQHILKHNVNAAWLSWERVVLDLHAGRFMGAAGPWVMDAFALLFMFLAGSGIYIWWISGKAKQAHKKRSYTREP